MRKTRLAPAPFPTIAPDPELASVVESFAISGSVTSVDGRPQIARFQTDDGVWIARGLASDQSIDQIKRRHHAFEAAALADSGFTPRKFPAHPIGTVEGGAPYEVVSFASGRSWMNDGRWLLDGHGLRRPLSAPEGGLERLAATIGRLHTISPDALTGLIPTVPLADYQRDQRRRWSEVRDLIRASGVQTVHIGRWLSASERVVFASRDVLQSVGFLVDQPDVICHGDLWPAHVTDGPGGIGLLDWTGMRISSPLTDIAQLIARFDGWSAASLETVVESYMAVRPITADERRLLPVFGALDLAIETGYLLAAAYVDDIDQTSMYAEAARSGAGQMLSALESIGWSIRKTNQDSKELRRESKERARALREPGRKPRPKQLSSKKPKP